MNRLDQPWGMGYTNSFLPSVRVGIYLEHANTTGYHRVNALYRQYYAGGIPRVLMLFTLSGKGRLRVQDRTHILSAGSIAVVPPNNELSYRTEGAEWEFYWINASGVRTEHLARTLFSEGRECFSVRSMHIYAQPILSLLNIEGDRIAREMTVSKTLCQIEDDMLTEIFFSHPRRILLSASIIAYLEEHFSEKITLDALSRVFFLSPNQLIEVFRKETGRTPYAYLKEYRLSHAQTLLQTTNLTSAQIARNVGFGSASNFCFQFSRAFGVSPQTWRKNICSDPEK